jgi:hypothetical protein
MLDQSYNNDSSPSRSAPAVRRVIRTDGMLGRGNRMAVWLMNVPVSILTEGGPVTKAEVLQRIVSTETWGGR